MESYFSIKAYCSSTDKNKYVFSKNLALYTKVLGVLGQAALSPSNKCLFLNNLYKPAISYFFLVQPLFISLLLLTENNCNWAFITLQDCLLPRCYPKGFQQWEMFLHISHAFVCLLFNRPVSQTPLPKVQPLQLRRIKSQLQTCQVSTANTAH